MWLTVEGIEQAYGDNRVLSSLSFRVPAGVVRRSRMKRQCWLLGRRTMSPSSSSVT